MDLTALLPQTPKKFTTFHKCLFISLTVLIRRVNRLTCRKSIKNNYKKKTRNCLPTHFAVIHTSVIDK